MATDLQNLQASRSNLITALVAATADPKPNYSINGQSVSWADYLKMLRSEISAMEQLIAAEDGPYEVVAQGHV